MSNVKFQFELEFGLEIQNELKSDVDFSSKLVINSKCSEICPHIDENEQFLTENIFFHHPIS